MTAVAFLSMIAGVALVGWSVLREFQKRPSADDVRGLLVVGLGIVMVLCGALLLARTG